VNRFLFGSFFWLFIYFNILFVISFQHCPRIANMVGHNLAKFSYRWEENLAPPGFIVLDVIRDVTLLSSQ
jgi:hypothetical protein